ncbi:hypothetical protein ANO11243_074680 [Dothideomycetidae sp. 11243]|nr:hypothetical protein ANO11243_074680 [fungal sp. No.11243]
MRPQLVNLVKPSAEPVTCTIPSSPSAARRAPCTYLAARVGAEMAAGPKWSDAAQASTFRGRCLRLYSARLIVQCPSSHQSTRPDIGIFAGAARSDHFRTTAGPSSKLTPPSPPRIACNAQGSSTLQPRWIRRGYFGPLNKSLYAGAPEAADCSYVLHVAWPDVAGAGYAAAAATAATARR